MKAAAKFFFKANIIFGGSFAITQGIGFGAIYALDTALAEKDNKSNSFAKKVSNVIAKTSIYSSAAFLDGFTSGTLAITLPISYFANKAFETNIQKFSCLEYLDKKEYEKKSEEYNRIWRNYKQQKESKNKAV
ncbi:MAG: hypothetical protein J0H68_01150 [Sphingobacteriia bacterium]|nr:hypothetical protein [Sphingobacteriia bacterium]